MSKYKYFSWHDIKDLAMIYHDREWDDAIPVLWDPTTQTRYRIYFTGSAKNENGPHTIHFNIEKID